MRLNRWWTALAAAALVVLAAAVVLTVPVLPEMPEPLQQEARGVEEVYRVVGAWEGHVAVFLPDSELPESVYDTLLSGLPEEDRTRLQSGIAVPDSTSLKRLLEDYLS